MGAKQSLAMQQAQHLITKQRISVGVAAQQCGITLSAIYMAKWYKEWKKAKKTAIAETKETSGT